MNLYDYFYSGLQMDEDGGGSAAIAADDPAINPAASTAASLPSLPTTKPDSLKNAAADFAGKLAEKNPEAKDKAEDKAEDKKETDPSAAKKEVDPSAKTETDPSAVVVEDADVALTPEEQEYVAGKLAELDQGEKALATLEMWSSTITPQTAAWFNQQREARAKTRAEAEATAAMASGKGLSEADKAEIASLTKDLRPVEFSPSNNWRSIKNLEETENFQPEYITKEKLQKEFGINPDQVPAKYAGMLTSLIAKHNKLAANASYIFKESKQSFSQRDQAKDQLMSHEFRQEIENMGYAVDDSVMMLKDEAKQMLHVNGARQPWNKVLGKLVSKHGKMFTPKSAPSSNATGAAASGAAEAAATPAPATTPKPADGTRNVKSAPVATNTPAPKTLRAAGESFADGLAALAEKARRK